jgi:hypothetical protein
VIVGALANLRDFATSALASIVLRRDRTLRSLAHAPGLPQVASLMGCNDMQARREAESNAANERIREARPRQVDVRVAP